MHEVLETRCHLYSSLCTPWYASSSASVKPTAKPACVDRPPELLGVLAVEVQFAVQQPFPHSLLGCQAAGGPVRVNEQEVVGSLSRLDATGLDCLLEYSWPGNVRELENAVEHAAVFCQDSVILPKHFPAHILGKRERKEEQMDVDVTKSSLADVERDHIRRVLSAVDGNRAEAAKILGIGEATLYRRLREAQHEGITES